MSEERDRYLVDLLRKDDYDAFQKIFFKYHEEIVNRSYQMTKNIDLSKDVAQDVFFELWKNRNKLPENIVLLPYLKRSTINRSLNYLKSRKHHMGVGEVPLTFQTSSSESPEDQAVTNELNGFLENAVNSLPERCRLIFVLCKQEGLSHKEVAEKLGISTKTIENQITKAMKSLRAAVLKYQTLDLWIWGILTFELLFSDMI